MQRTSLPMLGMVVENHVTFHTRSSELIRTRGSVVHIQSAEE